MYNDDKKSFIRSFRSYKIALKLSCVSDQVCRNGFPNLLKMKSNSYSTYSYSGIRSIKCNPILMWEEHVTEVVM